MTSEESDAIREAIFCIEHYSSPEISRARVVGVLGRIRNILIEIDTPALVERDELKRVQKS